MAQIHKVLCVCKGNTCRSPMFAALYQQALIENGYSETHVESAGVLKEAAGKPASAESVVCMDRLGINLRNHQSRWIGELDLSEFKAIICMDPEVIEVIKTIPGVNPSVVSLAGRRQGIPNPYGKDQVAYDDCAAAIEETVNGMFA